MVSRTGTENFIKRKDNLYTTTHYETELIAGTFSSQTKSIVARLRNCMVHTYNNYQILPKWVIWIVENDIIKALKYTDFGVTESYQAVLTWLFDELKTIRNELRDALPFKAKKYEWPYFLWIEPTLHRSYGDNEIRKIFTESLKQVSAKHEESITLAPSRVD